MGRNRNDNDGRNMRQEVDVTNDGIFTCELDDDAWSKRFIKRV